MKDVFVVFLVVCVLAFGLFTVNLYVRATTAELSLARAKAQAATGPCGGQFLAIVQNGDRVEQYVAGGRVEDPGEFYQEMLDGKIAVYRKGETGEKKLVMIRR